MSKRNGLPTVHVAGRWDARTICNKRLLEFSSRESVVNEPCEILATCVACQAITGHELRVAVRARADR